MTLIGLPYELIETMFWAEPAAREKIGLVNPLRQVPALIWSSGEIMTERAAILIDLADRFPLAGLAPAVEDAARRNFLRWMLHVSPATSPLHGIKPDVPRIGVPVSTALAVVETVHERIVFC